jgi:transmembrane sensor
MKEREDIDTQIVNFLSGESTAEEISALAKWIESSNENRAHFEAMEEAYFLVPKTEHSFDADRAWSKVNDELKANKETKSRVLHWRMWAAAAVLVAIGCIWYQLHDAIPEVQYAANDERIQQVLPNGIDMTLRENSSISYNETEQEVSVRLKGEAYFNVPQQTGKSFFVQTESVLIRDIGTSFRVRNRASDDTMFFNVDEGMIVCYANRNDSLRLAKGESGYYCRSTKKLGIRQPQPNECAYATKKLEYNNSYIETVIHDLQNIYGTRIVVQDPNLLQCTISVSFDRLKIEEIMEVIAITMNWSVEFSGQTWTISGSPCTQPL